MAKWFKRTKQNGLTITRSTDGTTWSKSTKGGSVRNTTTHYPNGKTVQTTTKRSPGGFTKIEKRVTNKQPKLPKIKTRKKSTKTRKVRYGKVKSGDLTKFFFFCIILSVIFALV